MGNQNSKFKIIGLLGIFALAFVYAWPNVYQEVPVVEISGPNAKALSGLQAKSEDILHLAKLNYQQAEIDDDHLSIQFQNSDDQLLARDILQKN